CDGDCGIINYIFLDNYIISYKRELYSRKFILINIKRTNILLSTFLEKINLKNISKLNLLEECNSCSDGFDYNIIIDYKGNRVNIDYDAMEYENLSDIKYNGLNSIFLFIKERLK
ncbi:MAG: hypothetical protein Q9M94_02475, partial [Candidatus Gracilibacteria bacterium]|nr:hypothetical protein [Candidatus Gracilibacteria bacterium]